jgi:Tfp pilus assembly protein FimT
MNTAVKIVASTAIIGALIGGTVAACSYESDDRVQVVQYGYYNPTGIWIVYPTAKVVWVSPATYKSDTKMYSKPSEVNSYTKTHTVTYESKSVKFNKDGTVTTKTTKTETKTTTNKTTKSGSGSSGSKSSGSSRSSSGKR